VGNTKHLWNSVQLCCGEGVRLFVRLFVCLNDTEQWFVSYRAQRNISGRRGRKGRAVKQIAG
jgi:hypothetical protein